MTEPRKAAYKCRYRQMASRRARGRRKTHSARRRRRPPSYVEALTDSVVAIERSPSAVIEPGGRQDHSGATSDEALVEIWLAGRGEHTILAYRRDVGLLLSFLQERGRSLRTFTVRDLNDWGASLAGKATTLARRLSAAKSLLTFGQKTGYLTVNVGAALKLPKRPNELAERILTEAEVHALVAATPEGHDRTLVIFLYNSAARGAEACQLLWKHLHSREDGEGVVTLHGKGGRTRHVPFAAQVLEALKAMRGAAGGEDRVFSYRGKHLSRRELDRIVARAGKKAGLGAAVSPHWLRHAHASHALDRGAPIHVVQATLGHASVATTGRYLHVRPQEGSSRFLSVPGAPRRALEGAK